MLNLASGTLMSSEVWLAVLCRRRGEQRDCWSGWQSRASLRENDLSWTRFDTAVASAAAIIPTGNLFHVTGKVSITSISGVGVTSGTEITLVFDEALTVASGSSLRPASNFTTAATNCSDVEMGRKQLVYTGSRR